LNIARLTIDRIRSIDDIDGELAHFFFEGAREVAEMYGGTFSGDHFDFLGYARHGLFLVCRRDGRPVGAMLARLYESIFDPNTIILCQDLLWVKPGVPRAAFLLLREFIDFGKANANHILTQVHGKTNIKGRSLEKLGFAKVEEIYRMEIR
jgi:hypothetical protein